jgi:hypothetical protein
MGVVAIESNEEALVGSWKLGGAGGERTGAGRTRVFGQAGAGENPRGTTIITPTEHNTIMAPLAAALVSSLALLL